MQQETQTMITCPKCGKAISASSDEEATRLLKAHDDEMHESSYQTECEKRSI